MSDSKRPILLLLTSHWLSMLGVSLVTLAGLSRRARCIRCHDEGHATTDKKTITQDCNTRHRLLAVREASPEILKTVGVADCMSEFERQ